VVPGQFFVEPDDGDALIVKSITQAHKSIDLTIYLLTERDVILGLKEAVKRHVAVRVLLEPHPVGGPGNQNIHDELQGAGIDVKWANPAFRLTHEKSLMLDRASAYIMTLNLTHSSFTSNREFGMLDTDPADVAVDEAIFEADWNRTAVDPTRADLVVAPNNARQKLTDLIASAHKTLLAEQEEMQDPGIVDALAAAAKRGVQVKLIVPMPQGGNDHNVSGEQRLASTGAAVRKLAAPYPHVKMYLADGQMLYVGSANASSSSLDDTRELGLIMSNADAIKRVQDTFAKDWAAAVP